MLRRLDWRDAIIWLWAGLGGALAIGVLIAASHFKTVPFWQIPFVTSIALVMGAPDSGPAQPKSLIFGHLISALCGYSVHALMGSSDMAIAVSVGLAIIAMLAFKVLHPPAAVDPFLVVSLGLPLSFLWETVGLGALILAAYAFVWHGLRRRLSR